MGNNEQTFNKQLYEIKEKQKEYSGQSFEELVELYQKEADILEEIVEADKQRIKEKLEKFKKNNK